MSSYAKVYIENEGKYLSKRIDQVCEDLVGHTNWSWGDPMTKDIAHIILIHKEPNEEEEEE